MKKYQIIYADPPWSYDDKRVHAGKNNPSGAGGAEKHYRTLSMQQLANFNIDRIVATDCVLFMWATAPFMDKAIWLLESWGFRYITIPFVWVKMKNDMSDFRRDGIGNYTLNNAEFVLLGRIGKYWRNSTKVKQIILSPKNEHSKKPDEVRNKIVELMGDLPRIELFAREKTVGWDVWGNEIESDIEL
jgi:site-specific DNA-methyltransferase (adenine-specific)